MQHLQNKLDSYSSVFSLTVLDTNQNVLVGVRTKINRTHHGVISTPTLRFPKQSLQRLIKDLDVKESPDLDYSNFPQQIHGRYGINFDKTKLGKERNFFDFENSKDNSRDLSHLEQELIYHAESLIPRKLLPDTKLPSFNYRFLGNGSLVLGSVIDDSDLSGDTNENIAMLNIAIETTTPELFPNKNICYEPLSWISKEDYQQMIRTRDVKHLPENLGNPLYCAQGLCLIGGNETLGDI